MPKCSTKSAIVRRRLVIFGAGPDAGPLASLGRRPRLSRDRRRRSRRLPVRRPVSPGRSGPRPLQRVRREGSARPAQLRGDHESPPRARRGIVTVCVELGCSVRGRAGTAVALRQAPRRARTRWLRSDGGRARSVSAALSAWPSARRRRRRSPSRFWGKSWPSGEGSTAASSTAARPVFTGRPRSARWRVRSRRVYRRRATAPAGISARSCDPRGAAAPAARRAPAAPVPRKNSRANRCGGAVTSPYRTQMMPPGVFRYVSRSVRYSCRVTNG